MRDNTSGHRMMARLRTASGLSLGLDGYNLAVIGAVLAWVTRAFHLAATLSTVLVASVVLGTLVGGLAAGWVTDHIGRRRVFAYDLVVFMVGALASGLAPTAAVLIASRLLMGLAIGADYAISSTHVAEMAGAGSRGYQLGFVWLFWAVGSVLAYLAAAGAAALFPTAVAWRLLLAVGAVPAAVALVLRQRVPESPRWLVVSGRPQEGQAVVDAYGLERIAAGSAPLSWGERWRRWALVTAPWFCYDFAAYGIGLLLPYLLQKSGLTGTEPALLGSSLVTSLGVAGSLVGMLVIDRWGRRLLQGLGFLVPGVLMAAWAAWPVLQSFGLFLAVVGIANGVSMMGGLVTGIYPAELFPTRQRATAMGVGTAVSRVGAVVGVVGIGILDARWGLPGVVAGAGTALGLAGALTLWLGIETKTRRLEEIAGDMAT
jgi:putative MFS transporter